MLDQEGHAAHDEAGKQQSRCNEMMAVGAVELIEKIDARGKDDREAKEHEWGGWQERRHRLALPTAFGATGKAHDSHPERQYASRNNIMSPSNHIGPRRG